MASQAFLELGDIKGPSLFKGDDKKNRIPLMGFTHELASEVDPATGPITKERRHKALTVTKNIDYTTPRLHRAMATAEVFDKASINFFHMPRSGDEKKYFGVVMSNVVITSIRTFMPSIADPNNSTIHEYEEVGFSYESISWHHTSPTSKTLEEGGYEPSTFKDVQATFAPDWIEAEAKAATLAMLRAATDQAKAQIKAQLEKEKK